MSPFRLAKYKRKKQEADSELNLVLRLKEYRLSRVIAIITLFGVFGAYFAGYFAYRQLSVMKGQLDQMVFDKRPWLGVTPEIYRTSFPSHIE